MGSCCLQCFLLLVLVARLAGLLVLLVLFPVPGGDRFFDSTRPSFRVTRPSFRPSSADINVDI